MKYGLNVADPDVPGTGARPEHEHVGLCQQLLESVFGQSHGAIQLGSLRLLICTMSPVRWLPHSPGP